MSNEKQKTEKQKPTSSIWMVLLGAGLLGFIGGIIGNLIDWKKEEQLADKNFQYQLFKDLVAIQNKQERENQIKLYYQTGLIDKEVVKLDLDSLIYMITRQRGQADGVAARGILGAIREFYLIEKKVPVNLNQLEQVLKIKNQLNYFNGDVHYKAADPKTFSLRFYGEDGVLYTEDDKKYSFSNLNIQ